MTRPGDTALVGYAAAREALLRRVTTALAADERFIAAWLAGSAGRGEADAVSDLDLTLVVADAQRDRLCARPWMTGAGTTSTARWPMDNRAALTTSSPEQPRASRNRRGGAAACLY